MNSTVLPLFEQYLQATALQKSVFQAYEVLRYDAVTNF